VGLPWEKSADGFSKSRRQRKQVSQTIRSGSQEHDAEAASWDSLLLRKALVDRHEDVEETVQGVKEWPIVQVAPSHLDGGADIVALQLAT
jgi:hypothetical protein